MKQHKVFSFRSQQEFTVIETYQISSPFKKKKIDCENVKDKEKILEASIGKSSSSTKEPEPKAIRVFTSYSRFQVSTWNFVATPLIKSEDPLQGFKTCRSFRNALVFIFYEQLFEKCAVAIEEKPRDLSCSWLCP